MGPKKNKKKQQQQQEDKIFEKAQKKLSEQNSKWAKALQQNEQEEQQFIQKKQVFDFSHESQYLRKLRQLEQKQPLDQPSSESQQQVKQEQLSDNQNQEQKQERLKRQQAKKQKKMKIKKIREQLAQLKKKLREQQKLKDVELQQLQAIKPEKQDQNDGYKVFLALLIFVILMGYIQYQAEIYQRYQRFKVTEGNQDLYTILEADSGLTDQQLKSKYKKLVLKYHPDKNKQCQDCKQKFNKIINAWEILGNQQKRKEYDQNYGVITKIKSSAITLTQNNFHILMDQSDDLWIIQVYDQTSEFCHRYSYIWEQVVKQYKGFVKFGRIDVWNQKQMLSYVPYSFSIFPGIYSTYKGNHDLFDMKLSNPVESLKNFIEQKIEGKLQNIVAEELNLSLDKPAVIIPTDRVSLPFQLRILAQKYKNFMQFYIVNIKKNRNLTKNLNLKKGARIFQNNLNNYENIQFDFTRQGFQLLESAIKKFVVRQLSLCKTIEQCYQSPCILILNSQKQIPKSNYQRIRIKDSQFYQQVQNVKNKTLQMENFELALYMDGKITFGYIEDIQGLTIDQGELIALQCKKPIIISYYKIGTILILIPAILKSGRKISVVLAIIQAYLVYKILIDFNYL